MEKKNLIWSGFLTNLLGVMLGIALTFGGNALWQQHEEKQRIKEMLILIRNELETNKVWFQNHDQLITKDQQLYKKILEAKEKISSIPKDTINEYFSQVLSWSDYQLSTSAWQIFQNSEMIQKMTNKELVIRITDCYFFINIIHETIKREYWDKKQNLNVYELNPYHFFDMLLNDKESVFFLTMWTVDKDKNTFWNNFPLIDAMIDYTILLLDNDGDYRYDMEEKDYDRDLYIKDRIDSVLNINKIID